MACEYYRGTYAEIIILNDVLKRNKERGAPYGWILYDKCDLQKSVDSLVRIFETIHSREIAADQSTSA